MRGAVAKPARKEPSMSRSFAFACAILVALFGLSSCGGGGKGKPVKEDSKPSMTNVPYFGANFKVPKTFVQVANSATSATFQEKNGLAMIQIEKVALTEGKTMDDYYQSEFENRRKETNKRKKNENAYKILKKNPISFSGKKALEIEQEFDAGAGTNKSHNIVVIVEMGESQLLTVTWEVPDIKGLSWTKAHTQYFKESRESLSLK
jgi:hypothetical protein